jgi:hypothetical protein
MFLLAVYKASKMAKERGNDNDYETCVICHHSNLLQVPRLLLTIHWTATTETKSVKHVRHSRKIQKATIAISEVLIAIFISRLVDDEIIEQISRKATQLIRWEEY